MSNVLRNKGALRSHAKSWLIGKDSDAERDWGQEEKGTTEDEMAGWYHWLDGCESKWTLGVGDGQGGLACCNSWGRKVGHDWATELNESTLAWKIPWMEEPGGPQSMGLLRIRHDWVTSLSLYTFMHWRRKWQTHSSIPSWEILWTEEPGRLQSRGSQSSDPVNVSSGTQFSN